MPKGFRRNRKVGRRVSKAPKMSFAKRVLSVLNKQRELKVGNPFAGNITDVRPDITALTRLTNVCGLLPLIAQGTGENNRIGNEIILKKIVMRGYFKMNLPTGSASASRILIRAAILRQRNVLDSQSLITGTINPNYTSMLEPGTSYTGSVGDFNTPWNKESFVVRKDFKRAVSTDYISSPAADAQGLAESYVFFNYTMTFGKGKHLNYRSDAAQSPEDFPFWMALSASTMSSAVVLPAGAITFNYVATPYFYDV